MNYIKRVIETTLNRYLKAFPAIGLTGPRQSGKSTLLRHVLPDYEYITFDDPFNIDLFENDPHGFLKRYNSHVIFDEVQHVPSIFNYIKIAIDQDRSSYGRFVLTGSSQFATFKKISESLSGRIGLLSLLPLQYSELPSKTEEVIYKGSYPELVKRNYYESELWYASYIDTYLNKDVRSLTNIGDMHDFQRFIRLLAANTTQVLDMSNYARDLGISVPTIKRWISILEASYIIFLLPPYSNNLNSRLIKRPKVYFYDTGLVAYFTGIKNYELYDHGPMAGSLFENYIIADIYKQHLHIITNKTISYIRTSDKYEIDLVIQDIEKNVLIEIKKTSTLTTKMTSTIKKFMQPYDEGILIYNGVKQSIYPNIKAIPYTDYLNEPL
ncbi:MAG: uncharacterized protein K0R14_624 [Burkholderiales bacterium]|jgi:predicted AAA+ superfamily ATPase|nr:uncharacterized protein [Burkholderiales bacterium]